jgi:hypothetical protein
MLFNVSVSISLPSNHRLKALTGIQVEILVKMRVSSNSTLRTPSTEHSLLLRRVINPVLIPRGAVPVFVAVQIGFSTLGYSCEIQAVVELPSVAAAEDVDVLIISTDDN